MATLRLQLLIILLIRLQQSDVIAAAATVQRKEQLDKANAQVYQDGDDLWTIQFTPLHKGTYSICIEARAAYGLQAVSNKY